MSTAYPELRMNCPLCGSANGCAMASGSAQACWCSREEIPKGGLAALFARAGLPFPAAPELARCICMACAQEARLIARVGDAGHADS